MAFRAHPIFEISVQHSINSSKTHQHPNVSDSQERLPEIVATDVRKAAIHEGDHYVVAKSLGYNGRIEIWNLIPETENPLECSVVCGKAYAVPLNAPRFHVSICSWRGITAEEYADDTTLDAGALSLGAKTHLDLYHASISDVEGIICHPQIWRTCRRACEMAIAHWQEIERIVGLAHESIITRGEQDLFH